MSDDGKKPPPASTPDPIFDDNTERLSGRLAATIASDQFADADQYTPVTSHNPQEPREMSASELIDLIANKTASKIDSSRVPSDAPKPPKLLGVTVADLIKYLIGLAIAIGTAYVGIKAAIDTNKIAIESATEQLKKHELLPVHPPAGKEMKKLDERLDENDRKLDRIDFAQQQTLEVVREIKDDVRDRRRRRPRTHDR